jgi:hypothetical protein
MAIIPVRIRGVLQIASLTAVLLGCAACAAPHDLVVGRAPDPRTPTLPTETAGVTQLSAGNGATPVVSGAAGTNAAMVANAAPPIKPDSIDETSSDNPAGLNAADVKKLVAGGPLAEMKWLYPYDGTVFPRGTITPLVMWHGSSAPDAVYFHMKSRAFEYKGVLKPAAEAGLVRGTGIGSASGIGSVNAKAGEQSTQLAIPADVWARAGEHSLGKGDPFTLELTERVNGQIHGPVVSHITIAQATLKGSIYYSSCGSGVIDASATDPFAQSGSNGEVLRIPPGGKAELVLKLDKCHGCHSVSADGSRLLVQERSTLGTQLNQAAAQNAAYSSGQGLSFQLGSDGKVTSTTGNPVSGNASYGALYPDGSKYLTSAMMARPVTGGDLSDPGLSFGVGMVRLWAGYDNASDLFAFAPAVLYDATTGQVIADTGIPTGAMMPMFSPDGHHLVFNDIAIDDARGLAVMDYDVHANKATNYRMLVGEPSTGPLRPGWPFFLPDDKAVVFVQTKTSSFTSDTIATSTTACANLDGGCGVAAFSPTAADGGMTDPNAELELGRPSDLYIADIASGNVTLLAKAMGFDTLDAANSGVTYLPYGDKDLHHNYFPTVSPVAAGGYFWVFFDSRRYFGSLGMQRALWGFAIDIQPDGNYARDPSHPPFYMPGQEFGTSSDNHRAFAALDRCRPVGEPCTTGIDCCDGRCSNTTCAAPPPNMNSCAGRDERCAVASDCCDASDYCINGYCALVELQ